MIFVYIELIVYFFLVFMKGGPLYYFLYFGASYVTTLFSLVKFKGKIVLFVVVFMNKIFLLPPEYAARITIEKFKMQ